MKNLPLIITSYAVEEIVNQTANQSGSVAQPFIAQFKKDVQEAYDSSTSVSLKHVQPGVTGCEFPDFKDNLEALVKHPEFGYRMLMEQLIDRAWDRSFRLM
ncbi:hypothetical protein VPHD479_0287 [Vibrio phage D479]